MLRRNVRSLLKLALVAALIVISTMLTLRLIGPPEQPLVNVGGAMPVAPAVNEGRAEPQQEMPHAKEVFEIVPGQKIDWHNYEQIRVDNLRKGPGEQGVPVHLKPQDEHEKEQLYKVNGFNALASDRIALNRSLPDIRHPGCRSKKYVPKLPQVSVVVPFHNEHLSTLLRTAISVLDRSPPNLVKEVILVDDFSSKDITKGPLDEYLRLHLPKVRVLRLLERSGLIRARLAGAREATAEVLIFLDSHTEANVNWLPPLLEPIAKDYRTCVCPFIDVIDYETFQYRAQDEGARGAFDWELFYKRLPLLPEDLKHPTEPFKSPVMAGGLFAMSTKFFWELGGYDEGLEIWGGEQYELSFKIWQCGGSMVDAPCSRVGHIYRKFAPFPNPHAGKDFVGKNYMRVADVWMDEYKEYILLRRPHYRNIDTGDLSQQKAIREKLKCKDFKWFMTEVAFDLTMKYPPVEPPDFASGEIRSVSAPELCVDTQHRSKDEKFGLAPCVKDSKSKEHGGAEQTFTLTWHKDIRPGKRAMCWDVASPDKRAPVTLWSCHGMQGNQLWRYKPETQQLVHGGNPRCLEADAATREIFVSKCDANANTQKWKFDKVDLKALANWENVGPK